MNEYENLIAAAMADRDGLPARGEPGHFYLTDLIDVTEGIAAPDLVAEVESHCRTCAQCRKQLESLQRKLAANGPQPLSDDFAQGHTITAQEAAMNAAAWPAFVTGVRPVLAAYLHRNGIDPVRVDEVLASIRPRLVELVPTGRFRDAVPNWVADFLRAQPGAAHVPALPPITKELFAALVLDAELLETATAESGAPRDFCRAALADRLSDGADLLRFAPSELKGAAWLTGFRIQLFNRVAARKAESARVYQLN